MLAAAFAPLSSARTASALDLPPVNAPREMFRAHREKFLAKLAPGSVAILHAAPLRTMSNGGVRHAERTLDFCPI